MSKALNEKMEAIIKQRVGAPMTVQVPHKFPGSIRFVPAAVATPTGDHEATTTTTAKPPEVVAVADVVTGHFGSSKPSDLQLTSLPDEERFLGVPEMVFPGICMSDIARDTGLTVGGVSRIFNGLRKAKKHTLKSIANIYCEGKISEVVEAIRRRVLEQVKASDRRSVNQRDPNREKKLEIVRAYDATRY